MPEYSIANGDVGIVIDRNTGEQVDAVWCNTDTGEYHQLETVGYAWTGTTVRLRRRRGNIIFIRVE